MKKIYIKKIRQYSCKVVTVMAGIIMFSSCEDFIDVDQYFYDKVTIDSVFVSKEKTIQYLNGTASYLLDESKIFSRGSYFASGIATDELFVPWVDANHNGMYLLVDQVTPRNTRYNRWPDLYKGIRKANIIIARINENRELTDLERRDYTGCAHFLRAYFYYNLVRMYGPVPILPDIAFDTDEPASNASFERSSYDDCVDYICADLERAAELLPVDREQAYQYMPTKGAALAVLGRQRLHSASPLFNGNTYYTDWLRSDGTHFISQTEDKSKWGKAAAVYKQIIELGKYELNLTPKIVSNKGTGTLPLPATVPDADFPYGAGNIDPYKSYKTIFDGSILPTHNKELIYFIIRTRDSNDDWTFYPNPLGGINGLSVTQDMIDAYRMADGRQYSEANDFEKSWEPVGDGLTFSENYILDAERARMHDNREPRFYASIGFNHCVWPGTSFRGTEPLRNFVANYYRDGNSQPSGNIKVDYNRTGYTIRKYVNQEDILHWNSTYREKTYPLFRYAEILLGYVEAMNEMDGTYEDEKTGVSVSKNLSEMVFYFNQIRFRAGLPGITESDAANYEEMKKLIKQEWQVEFAFEDRRYYDLRRWRDAYNAYNRPITGMDVSANISERQKFYTVRVWNTEVSMKRVFSNKMFFYPIDQSVLDKNGKLVQNPGW